MFYCGSGSILEHLRDIRVDIRIGADFRFAELVSTVNAKRNSAAPLRTTAAGRMDLPHEPSNPLIQVDRGIDLDADLSRNFGSHGTQIRGDDQSCLRPLLHGGGGETRGHFSQE